MTLATRCSAPGYQANWDLVSPRVQSINHAFMSSAVQKYNLSYICMYSSSSTGTLRTSNATTSQLVEHCAAIAEVTVQISFRPEIFFFQALLSQMSSYLSLQFKYMIFHIFTCMCSTCIGKMVSCVTWFVVSRCLSQKVVRAQEEVHLTEIVETVCSQSSTFKNQMIYILQMLQLKIKFRKK